MRKIINRMIYDTKTATLIAECENMLDRTDFHWYSEELYLTKKGQYFLHGEGGPASKYAKSSGSTSYGSSNIVLLSNERALDWLEEHNYIDEIEKYFKSEITEG